MTPQDEQSPSPHPAAGDSTVHTTGPRSGSVAATLEGSLERLAGALLVERRRERRWRIFFRLAWLGLALVVAFGLLAQRAQTSTGNKPHTALIEVRGEIGLDSEASAENLVSALKSAFEDPAAQAIVLRINSPGGSPVQSGIVNDEIRRLKSLHAKKVYAVVEEMCASGAYYIAVAADEIFVDK
ncbi:MAG: S49 family peptidase, partial [Burkholderiales bacterium]|nr:S49 family peptidase [Burkholderiales bacterium]